MPDKVIVIGAGQAGASLVAKLRNDGFEGTVTLIGAEPVPPYQRPPLSKKYLLGEMAEERLKSRSPPGRSAMASIAPEVTPTSEPSKYHEYVPELVS